jgi:type IV pilus assembly protein PilE
MRNSNIARHITPGRLDSSGFTLVELMITVVIVAILASIAIPAYNAQIRKSRRTEAKTALLDLAGREERFFNTNNAYTNVPANLGYTALTPTLTNLVVGNGYYTVTVNVPSVAPAPAAPYSIDAAPVGDQANDLQCATFTVVSTGQQIATSTIDASASTDCWK